MASLEPSAKAWEARDPDVLYAGHALPWYEIYYRTGEEEFSRSFTSPEVLPLWEPMQHVQSRLQGCLGALWPDPVP